MSGMNSSEIDDLISANMASGSGAGSAVLSGEGSGSAGVAGFNPEEAQNDESIEQQFAVMCFEQAEAYFNLITKVKPSELKRLTKWDDEIMESFKTHFPDYQSDEKLRILDENEMKSPAGKKRWRDFMMPFDKKIDEYNFGTLIRTNCEEGYTEENSMFGKSFFYAIEIARNRRGLNDVVWKRAQEQSSS
ncbi:hypothetical protein C6P46_001912 [Rhodotorula mucilaginosa]|uniref:Polysaccharide biosynthesis domain-containing protein n=1 Tax=Rhodotorula mucilaginosa TaxID=5537 RepID=A0A9P7B856_RHOMI|nr:hypothetical protein C6P46_001912 [Rhodotorula mucilaginosa]